MYIDLKLANRLRICMCLTEGLEMGHDGAEGEHIEFPLAKLGNLMSHFF